MSPTWRVAVLVAVVALSAFALPFPLVVLALVAVLAVAVVDALSARRPPTVARAVAGHLARDVPAPFEVAVSGAGGGSVRVRQPLPAGLDLEPSERSGGIDGRITARRRGRYRLAPIAVRSTGPLGLGRWDHQAGEPVDVLVYPDLPAAWRLAHQVRTGRFRDPGLRARGALGLGTDFEQIREYSPDDDVRRINWRATERTGHPMANQYREDTERDVVCLIDSGRLMAAPIGDATRLDVALDAVMAVAAVADVVGDRVGAVAFAADLRQRLSPRRAGGERVAQTLFDLEPEPVDADYERAFRSVGTAKRSLVLVFTDLVDEAAAGPLLEAVPVLARRHAVAVATTSDPDLAELAAGGGRAAQEVYAAAVASDLLAAQRSVAVRLERAGAVVVDVPADRLPAACVAAYLSLKARARL
jgi:uncharacterized protein (DUF58 family)